MPANFSFDSYRSGVMPKLEVPTRLGGRSRSERTDRKSTRLNSSHSQISYAVFCLNKIKSVGSYVPSGILTNADLEKMVETSDTWIRERTGIHERRIAAVNETATDLAAEAARDALAAAGLRPQDTDLIVCSTSTPDSMFPSVASRVQERLGAHGPAFHAQAACTGFP